MLAIANLISTLQVIVGNLFLGNNSEALVAAETLLSYVRAEESASIASALIYDAVPVEEVVEASPPVKEDDKVEVIATLEYGSDGSYYNEDGISMFTTEFEEKLNKLDYGGPYEDFWLNGYDLQVLASAVKLSDLCKVAYSLARAPRVTKIVVAKRKPFGADKVYVFDFHTVKGVVISIDAEQQIPF